MLFSYPSLNILHVVGCGLVDVVIQPVGIEQIRAGSPADDGLLCGIVVGEIVSGGLDGQSRVLVAQVFLLERVRVVFRVTRDKYLSAAFGHAGKHARLGGACQDADLGHLFNVLAVAGGVARMGRHKLIVEATEKDGALVIHLVGIDAGILKAQRILLDTVMVVQTCLSAPADVEGAGHVGLAPLHNFAELVPILDILKFHLLHVLRGTDLEKDYQDGKFSCLTLEEYAMWLQCCLSQLPEHIVVHRITGDGAKKDLVAPLWSADKKRVLNYLQQHVLTR